MNYEDLEIGQRVRYIGEYVQNGLDANPSEDLATGIEGTITYIFSKAYGFPVMVKFDDHADWVKWNVSSTEIERI